LSQQTNVSFVECVCSECAQAQLELYSYNNVVFSQRYVLQLYRIMSHKQKVGPHEKLCILCLASIKIKWNEIKFYSFFPTFPG
jgi:hypothetical protein